MKESKIKWIYLIGLAIVWGSSFILIKYALVSISPVHVGALRILITAFFLILVAPKSIIGLSKKHWYYLSLNALLGTFFPAFLFAFAIVHLDSAMASILNSFTPFNTLIFGALVFGFSFKPKQLFGILIGLVGTVLLILNGESVDGNQNYFYASFILLASVGYAFNVNIIKRYLFDLKPLSITTGNFVLLIIPALLVLYFSDFFTTFVVNEETTESLFYLIILAIVGTAIAKTFFNKLVLISSPIFSASVTYLIPIVAVFWGVLDGEKVTLMQLGSGLIILLGVYLVNKVKK
jgi:drug/metabolite transporter (DMT)-like permease